MSEMVQYRSRTQPGKTRFGTLIAMFSYMLFKIIEQFLGFGVGLRSGNSLLGLARNFAFRSPWRRLAIVSMSIFLTAPFLLAAETALKPQPQTTLVELCMQVLFSYSGLGVLTTPRDELNINVDEAKQAEVRRKEILSQVRRTEEKALELQNRFVKKQVSNQFELNVLLSEKEQWEKSFEKTLSDLGIGFSRVDEVRPARHTVTWGTYVLNDLKGAHGTSIPIAVYRIELETTKQPSLVSVSSPLLRYLWGLGEGIRTNPLRMKNKSTTFYVYAVPSLSVDEEVEALAAPVSALKPQQVAMHFDIRHFFQELFSMKLDTFPHELVHLREGKTYFNTGNLQRMTYLQETHFPGLENGHRLDEIPATLRNLRLMAGKSRLQPESLAKYAQVLGTFQNWVNQVRQSLDIQKSVVLSALKNSSLVKQEEGFLSKTAVGGIQFMINEKNGITLNPHLIIENDKPVKNSQDSVDVVFWEKNLQMGRKPVLQIQVRGRYDALPGLIEIRKILSYAFEDLSLALREIKKIESELNRRIGAVSVSK